MMRILRPAALALVVAVTVTVTVAGCGGSHAGSRHVNTGSRPVSNPLGRPLPVTLKGSVAATAALRSDGSKRTAVTLRLHAPAARGLTAELAKGSCGAPRGLQTLKPLGKVSGRGGSWSVTAGLTQLTGGPLAVVLRRGGRVVSCGAVRTA